jgi:hypothetical protein
MGGAFRPASFFNPKKYVMYYSIKVWDDKKSLEKEGTCFSVEELLPLFAQLDMQYPAEKGYELRLLYIPETFVAVEREEFRDIAYNQGIKAVEQVFSRGDEEML